MHRAGVVVQAQGRGGSEIDEEKQNGAGRLFQTGGAARQCNVYTIRLNQPKYAVDDQLLARLDQQCGDITQTNQDSTIRS